MTPNKPTNKPIEGCVHVGGEGPEWKLGMPRKNPPPEGKFLVIHAYFHRSLDSEPMSRYCNGVDKNGDPTYTEIINECAKFAQWTAIKKFWRNTSRKPPHDMPHASCKIEAQAFGKGPAVQIRTK